MLDIKTLLSRLTYLPNVSIEYDPNDEYRIGLRAYPQIRVDMYVLDARQDYPDNRSARRVLAWAMHGGAGTNMPDYVAYPEQFGSSTIRTLNITPQRVGRTLEIPYQIAELEGDSAERMFYEWLDDALWRILKHEHHEWFQVDGEPFIDPHPEQKRGIHNDYVW